MNNTQRRFDYSTVSVIHLLAEKGTTFSLYLIRSSASMIVSELTLCWFNKLL